MLVSPAASSALAHRQFLPWLNQVTEKRVCRVVINYRPRGNRNHQVWCPFTAHVAAATVSAIFCHKLALIAEPEQCVQLFIYAKDYISAPAAVSTIRPSTRNVLFAAEMHHSRPAAA